jgi:RecJ-like exonuclease
VFEDLFGDFMGGGRGGAGGGGARARAQRGSDLRYNLRVSLEEAYSGLHKTISVQTAVACDTCRGTGAEGGSEPVGCPTCGGVGKVRAASIVGFETVLVRGRIVRVVAAAGRVRRRRFPHGRENGGFVEVSSTKCTFKKVFDGIIK